MTTLQQAIDVLTQWQHGQTTLSVETAAQTYNSCTITQVENGTVTCACYTSIDPSQFEPNQTKPDATISVDLNDASDIELLPSLDLDGTGEVRVTVGGKTYAFTSIEADR